MSGASEAFLGLFSGGYFVFRNAFFRSAVGLGVSQGDVFRRVSDGVFEFVVGEEVLAIDRVVVVFFEVEGAGFQMNQIIIFLVLSFTGQ